MSVPSVAGYDAYAGRNDDDDDVCSGCGVGVGGTVEGNGGSCTLLALCRNSAGALSSHTCTQSVWWLTFPLVAFDCERCQSPKSQQKTTNKHVLERAA